jgi:hypothetical protein
VRRFQGRDDAFGAAEQLQRFQRFQIGDGSGVQATGALEVRQLGTDAGIVKSGGDRVRFENLAVFVL